MLKSGEIWHQIVLSNQESRALAASEFLDIQRFPPNGNARKDRSPEIIDIMANHTVLDDTGPSADRSALDINPVDGRAAYPDRLMHRSSQRCALQCAYCFADFSSFRSSTGPGPVQAEASGDFVIVYPTCDSEFQADRLANTEIDRIVRHTDRKVCISISTKGVVTPRFARILADWNRRLQDGGRGLLKCSLSITSKRSIDEIEPLTSTYLDRIASLGELAARNVPASVNLKPILPMVSVEEYAEIVEDASTSCDMFLTGGLYLDLSTSFGAGIAKRYGHLLTQRRVEWMTDGTVWPYCEDPGQIESIAAEVVSRGGSVFASDTALVNALLARTATEGRGA
jgi:hypothetical protein